MRHLLGIGIGSVAGLLALAATAAATPSQVTISPPDGSRFLVGQRFDLRVEGRGAGPYSATLIVDGRPVAFSSGEQGTVHTDGITLTGFGGFNRRGWEEDRAGEHSILATFSDADGAVVVTSRFIVVEPWGWRRPARNVILMVGDGMGVAHRTAARIVRYGVTAGDPNGYLAMDKLPSTGLITTHSLNSIITDSAPGMSAYVTGSHQNNNQEGVFPANVTNPFFAPRVEYLSEYMHRYQGKVLGLVSTADLEDATPAANAVHTLARGAGTGIVDQYLDEADLAPPRWFGARHGTGLRVLLGGGRRWFLPAGDFASSRAASSDYPALPQDLVDAWNLPPSAVGAADAQRDLLADFRAAGFHYVEDAAGLDDVRAARRTPDKLLGLFAYGNMNVALDKIAKRRGAPLPGASGYVVDDYRAPNQPMLDEMTEAALAVLDRHKRGFVLMVEGAHIDKQSHTMDAERVIGDTIEFDNAVAVARSYAERNRDTLVLVFADHECSGFSLIGALTGGVKNLRDLPSDAAALDPATAPGRQRVVGVYENAGFPQYSIAPDGYPATYDVDGKLLVGYGASADRYEGWLTRPQPTIDSLLSSEIQSELAAKGYVVNPVDRAEKVFGFFIRGQAAGRTSAVHTAADIPISAYGVNRGVHEQFVGVQRNTDVFFKVARALLGGY